MRFKKANIFIKIVILALIVYASASCVTTLRAIQTASANNQTLENQVKEAEQKNAELKYDTEHADDDSVIADFARDKLGFVTPDEKIYIDING